MARSIIGRHILASRHIESMHRAEIVSLGKTSRRVGRDHRCRAGRPVTLTRQMFRPEAIQGAAASQPGTVDYRLARQALVAEYRKKRLARHEVCDAHPELVRAARELGEPTSIECPICEEANVVLVSYVFGPGSAALRPLHQFEGRAGQAQASARRHGVLRRRGVPELLVEPPGPRVSRRPGAPFLKRRRPPW